ncbi:phosphotransferase enzyme family protein [Dictyobacter kobayashii]|uniref:Homoserine kinase n=1 Tax=Dictyobacter kobayashii TaxID=2014872 RepID=A0A402AXB5_9CHLR|nr:phosphotransferase [Dictyobacter kobayashii]GCE23727.1 homoserine kinase [Dictyobacter kobayashii]
MDTSSYNSQIRQLRILAEAALTQYDIGSARLTMLSHGKHAVFRVTTYSRPGQQAVESATRAEDGRFALHLCQKDGFDRALWNSELQWLAALKRDTDLLVPEPVATRDGALMQEVQIEDIDQECICLLLRWLPGRSVDWGLSPTLFERVGIFLARLHQYAKQFIPPEGFVRPRWDWQQVFGDETVLDPDFAATRCDGLIGGREYRIFSEVAERARDEFAVIPTSPEYYGLIHGNFRQDCYLFYKGEVGAIGFHKCGWNYYLADLSITLEGVAGRNDEEALEQALLRGYERVRALPDHYEEWLRIFKATRLLEHINSLFRSNDLALRASAPSQLTLALEWLGVFVHSSFAGRSFPGKA